MLCWCTACFVGAVLAWLVQLRQLHPLTACLVGALFAWLVQFLLWQAAKPSGDNCTPLKCQFRARTCILL